MNLVHVAWCEVVSLDESRYSVLRARAAVEEILDFFSGWMGKAYSGCTDNWCCRSRRGVGMAGFIIVFFNIYLEGALVVSVLCRGCVLGADSLRALDDSAGGVL